MTDGMSDAADILVLAGTREAVELAQALGAACLPLRPDLPAPARPVQGPFDPAIAGPWRGIVCGAHPFHPQVADRVAARRPDLTLVMFRRPPWAQGAGLHWQAAATLAQAVALLPPGGTVFAATGRESEPELATYTGRAILRQNAPHNDPPGADNIDFHFGTRSFDVEAEAQLFADLGVTALLARNLGGSGGLGKLHAAARLGLPIVMLERPATPGPVFSRADEVRAHLKTSCG